MSVGFISTDPLNNLTNLYQRPISIVANRAPTTNDLQPPMTFWQSGLGGTIYQTSGAGIWNTTGTAGVASITGTANQISASSSTGAVTLSLTGPYTPSTFASNGILYGNGTSSIQVTAVGSAGQVLTSNGVGMAPTFQTSSSGGISSITTQTGGALTGALTVQGLGVIGGGLSTVGNLYVSNSGNTVTIQQTQAQYVSNYIRTPGANYTVLATDNFISVTVAGGTVTLPATTTANRIFTVKDASGNAETSPITISAGGTTMIDGATTELINADYESVDLVFDAIAGKYYAY